MASDEVERALEGHVDAGRLTLWTPSRPAAARAGRLYLAASPLKRVRASWVRGTQDREALRKQAWAVFDQFTELGRALIHLVHDAFGRTGIAQLEILAPKPGARLFGALVDPDTYVGTRLYLRDQLPFKPTKQVGEIAYRNLGKSLQEEWDRDFPDLPRRYLKELRKEL